MVTRNNKSINEVVLFKDNNHDTNIFLPKGKSIKEIIIFGIFLNNYNIFETRSKNLKM